MKHAYIPYLNSQYEIPSVHITCIVQYVTKMSPYCFTCDETTVDVAYYFLKVALVIQFTVNSNDALNIH